MTELYDTRGKFIGDHASPEHKAHIARIAREQEVWDAVHALCILGNPVAAIEDRGNAARDLEATKELLPAAYAEACEKYEKAGLFEPKARKRPFSPADSRIGDVFTSAPPAPPFVVD